MAIYALSFRIKDEGNADERRQSLVDKVNELTNEGAWDGTTSFFVFESDWTPSKWCRTLRLDTKFDPDKGDKIVVLDLTNRDWDQRGANDDDLKELLDRMKNE